MAIPSMHAIRPELADRILAAVCEDEIVSMSCDVINIPSPTGEELRMAEYMREAWERLGLAVTWQLVEEGRPNVIACWRGPPGRERTLMFNGHMDTSNTGREPFLTGVGYKPHAVVRDGFIYGLGIYNMKGALVCYTQAVKALQRAGVRLKGSIMLAAVVGEIEKTEWGDYKGGQYRGYGVGTRHLVAQGELPDMCILGEPTDMKLVLAHAGSLWARISTKGIYVHTAFAEGRERQNALHRMHDVMGEVLRWSADWREKAAWAGHQGVVNLGCSQAGDPWRASRTPPRADLFIDVRVPPTIEMAEARRQIEALVEGIKKKFPDYGTDFETFVSVPGATIPEDHEMVVAIDTNHARVMGVPPQRDVVLWCSDASTLSRHGVPTVNYGPSSGPRDEQGEKVAIKTLLEITKVYALTAAELCGGD
jgi:acetylornithine deacetylase/succinyl-diaminopimelate desuccinylase-like protein